MVPIANNVWIQAEMMNERATEQHHEQHHEQHYVYIALCADGSLYTGYSKNVEQRLKTHNLGNGGRYTRAHRPLKLLASWSMPTKTCKSSTPSNSYLDGKSLPL